MSVSRQSGETKKKEKADVLDTGNRLLVLAIICSLGYGMVRYFADDPVAGVSRQGQDTAGGEAPPPVIKIVEPKPFQIYEEAVNRRDLFQPFAERFQADTAVLEKAMPALHQCIKVIGILKDKDSKAIVEDLNDQQTHFLSKGESIGTARLEDIEEDKVIFIYNNERVEMSP
jgi:hypothetical protein